MELYLMRHGKAEDPDPARGVTEENRGLTGAGAEQIEAAARGLRCIGFSPDVIFCSTLRRAMETAAIVARGVGATSPVVQRRALGPGFSLDALRELLLEGDSAERVLCVGHNPGISWVAGVLSGRDVELHLPPGGLARIDLQGPPRHGRGELVWLLTPQVLAR